MEDQKTFRALLAASLQSIRHFDGTDHHLNELTTVIARFETWLRDHFHDEGIRADRLSDDEERQVIAGLYFRDRTINALLEKARSRLERLFIKAIYQIELPDVVLPPAPAHGLDTGSGQSLERPVMSCLSGLIRLLHRHGIPNDQILIASGKTPKKTMRRESYRIVEIPRLRRQVLICDQVGEATFVIYGLLDRAIFLRLTKEELLSRFSDRVIRIVFTNPIHWESELQKALFDEEPYLPQRGDGGHGKKTSYLPPSYHGRALNIPTCEDIRARVQGIFTPVEWCCMHFRLRAKLNINSLKLRSISKLFGIEGDASVEIMPFLELGLRIFGDDHQQLQTRFASVRNRKAAIAALGSDLEPWRTAIRTVCPDGKAWVNKRPSDYRRLKLPGGIGLGDMAQAFQVPGSVYKERLVYLQLGEKIFPNDPALSSAVAQERERLVSDAELPHDAKSAREHVLRHYPESKDWGAMSSSTRTHLQKTSLKISILRLAILLSCQRCPKEGFRTRLGFLKLGLDIYGEDDACLQTAIAAEESEEQIRKRLGRDPEKWRAEILARFPSAINWLNLNFCERDQLSVHGLGPFGISRIFKCAGNLGNPLTHLRVGARIYGQDNPLIRPLLDPEERNTRRQEWLGESVPRWAEEVRNVIPTATDWLRLGRKRRFELRVHGLSLYMLAQIMGVKDYQESSRMSFLQLGEKVYGAEDPVIQKALQEETRRKTILKTLGNDQEAWRKVITRTFPTASAFLAIPIKERGRIPIDETHVGADLLGKIFGIPNPQKNIARSTHRYRMLAAAIYGWEAVFVKQANNIL